MLSLEQSKKSQTIFSPLTGLNVDTFNELMENLEKAYPDFEKRRLSRPNRKRAIGAGGKFNLSLPERVFMTLFFFRHYPTYALLSFLFELHESDAYRDIFITKGSWEKHLPLPERVRKKKISSINELLEEMPGLEVLIDTTEQEVQKPKEKGKRKSCYSGRKKRHTLKTQVTSDREEGLILDISCGWDGGFHDLKVLESSGLEKRMPKEKVRVWVEEGYVGMEWRFPCWVIKRPIKKPKGRDLTEEEKEYNRSVNRVGVRIEHLILLMKRFRVMGGLYRGRRKGYEKKVQVVAGLEKLEKMRVEGKEWEI